MEKWLIIPAITGIVKWFGYDGEREWGEGGEDKDEEDEDQVWYALLLVALQQTEHNNRLFNKAPLSLASPWRA